MAEASKTYTLVSNDNVEFAVSDKIVAMSEVLKEMLAHCSDSNKVPIPDIDGETLDYIVRFCNNYEDSPAYVPPKAGDPNNVVPASNSWDMEFLYIKHDTLLKIVNAASYLNIPRLIDACCYRIQLMAQGRSTEEIRTIFKIPNDFTEAEEAQIKKDHIWYDCPLPKNPKFLQNQ